MEKTIIDESWTLEQIIGFVNQRNGILENIECRVPLVLINNNNSLVIKELKLKNSVFNHDVVLLHFDSPSMDIEITDCQISLFKISDSNFFTLEVSNSSISMITLTEVQFVNPLELEIDEKCHISLYDVKCLYCDLEYLSDHFQKLIVDSPNLNITVKSQSINTDVNIENADSIYLHGNFNQIELKKFNEMEVEPWYDIMESSLINNIKLDTKNFKGSLLISDYSIENFEFINFFNSGGTILLDSLTIRTFSVENSILGKTQLNSIAFQENVFIINSNISTIQYVNVKWIPKTYISIALKEFLEDFLNKEEKEEVGDFIDELRSDRDAYRQLKLVAQNMKNKHDELEFARLENRLLWKEARVSKSMNWQDRIIIWSNRWSADFGQSWAMPLCWLLGIHFILFMCIFNWQFSCHSADFKKGLGEYFELLNPAHRSPEYINTGMGKVTEFAMRLSGGFFIYHFLRATRKYVQS